MKSYVKIRLIQKKADFQELKEEWRSLLEDCSSKNIFLTWEWLFTWWKFFSLNNSNHKLSLIELRDRDGRLIGIGPFKLNKTKFSNRSEFIGNGADVITEYLDLIIRKGYETTVRECASKLLNEFKGADVISFKPFMRGNILDWNDIKWPYRRMQRFSRCPVVDLPTSWDEFLKNKSKNFKKKSKEHYRVCRRDLKLRLIRVDSAKELQGRMKDLERLHHCRWSGMSASFNSEAYRQFHLDIARQFLENGWLRLFFLLDGKKEVAALYCFAYDGVYYYYQSGRDPAYAKYRVGFVLMNLVIQEAIREGARRFDMLTGEEVYKYRWADRDNICYHFLAFKNTGAYLRYYLQSFTHKFFFWHNHRI